MKALIPVKAGSSRCVNKNFREFADGASLLDIKLTQLLACLAPGDIVIASESPLAAEVAERFGVKFLHREEFTTRDNVAWSDVLCYLESRLPGDDDLALVLATTPLFDGLADVFARWEELRSEHDSLVVATPFQHYLIDSSGRPVNFQFGHWHRWSQQLDSLLAMQWACTIAPRATIRKYSYFIGASPYVWPARGIQFDIDTEEEFHAARVLYRERHPLTKPGRGSLQVRTEGWGNQEEPSCAG